MNTNALSAAEAERLTQLEAVLAKQINAWTLTAKALGEIRDRRLYRASHSTFEDYLALRWDMSAGHAYRLIRAEAATADVARGVTLSVRQADALAKAPPEHRQEVFTQAGGEGATLEQIEEAAIPFQGKRKAKRKKPRDVRFRGKGWQVIVKRSKDLDLEPIWTEVSHLIHQKKEAA